MSSKTTFYVSSLRSFRKIHRLFGIIFFGFFILMAVSGLLLGWKKNSGGYLLAETKKGTNSNLKEWLPLDSLEAISNSYVKEKVDRNLSLDIERIDVRKDKGIVKFIYADSYLGLQVDGATGSVLSVEKRRSDFVENLHDGSYIDKVLNLKTGYFKVFYTSVMGISLLIFTITGFWLWYAPRKIKQIKNS